MARVMVAESDLVLRERWGALLQDVGLSVVAEAVSAVEAVSQVLELGPDVAILGAGLAEAGAFSVLDVIRSASPLTGIVLVGGDEDPAALRDALAHGAACWLPGEPSGEALELATAAVMRGYTLTHRPALQQALAAVAAS